MLIFIFIEFVDAKIMESHLKIVIVITYGLHFFKITV